MKIWPFGKRHNEPEEDGSDKELSIVESGELTVVSGGELLDIKAYEHKSFEGSAIGDTAFLDAIIPAAGAAADAAAQYGHAVVRFPEGANWADLINRKTPGWEGFKQLGILKDGKFQPQAAIKQAKLQPAAVGNLALQGAAMVVGQMYMVEINKQLEEVTTGIAAIQEEMRLERESNIEACMELLKEYSESYLTIVNDPVEHQAVRNQIEGIRKEAKGAWTFQMSLLRSMERSLRKPGKLKEDDMKAKMREFAQRDKAAHDAFVFLMAAEQVKMQYSQNYSESQITKERESIQGRTEEYNALRDEVQQLLLGNISKLGGKPLAIPSAREVEDNAVNPVVRLGQRAKKHAPRIFLPNMLAEAKRQREDKKDNYKSFVKRDNPIIETADSRIESLDEIEFIYNRANALFIDESGIHYLYENNQVDSPEEN